MQPQTQTSGTGSLDPQAVMLAKAIRQTETGGDFNATGDKKASHPSYGAYQFGENTWNSAAKKYGINVPIQQATPEQQNEVAYKQIKEWKDAGYNPGQIASMWNAGADEPDAYTGKFSNGQSSVKTGEFNVPAYAKSVATAYQTLKSGGQVSADPNNPSSIASPEMKPVGKDLLQKTGDIVNTVFPGKQIGESIGTLGGLAYEKMKGLVGGQDNSASYDISAPSPVQVAGDAAQVALTVGAGLPGKALGLFGKTLPIAKTAETALGRIGQGGLLGAGIGTTGAIANGDTAKNVATQGIIGGALGGSLGGVGEIFSKAANTIPERITRSFVPGINKETAQYAISKGLGSPEKMLTESETSIKDIGSKLGDALKNPKYADVHVSGDDIVNNVIKKYPDAQLTPEIVWGEVKKLAKLKTGLVAKLEKGENITLDELHDLNSTLGSNTFKTVFDDPTVKAGKDIGSAVYHAISDKIKGIAPETTPLFESLSKEYPLRKALTQTIRRGEKSKTFTLRDLVAITAGLGAAGPAGIIPAYLGEKALTSPTVNMKVGGILSNLGKRKVSGVVKPLIIKQINQSSSR